MDDVAGCFRYYAQKAVEVIYLFIIFFTNKGNEFKSRIK